MAATIALAHAGGTTGEWAGALREVFGEFRAPTGVSGGVGHRGDELGPIRLRTRALAERTGGPPRLLVANPASTATPTELGRSRSPRRNAGSR